MKEKEKMQLYNKKRTSTHYNTTSVQEKNKISECNKQGLQSFGSIIPHAMMSFVNKHSKGHCESVPHCTSASYLLCITEALCKLCYAFVNYCSTPFNGISKSHAQVVKEQITSLLLS